MTRKSRLVPTLAALLAAGALFAAGCGDDDGDSPDQAVPAGTTIKLGSIFSTTGAGAAFGPQQVKGAQLAIKELNEDEGIDGVPVELTQLDDEADPVKSAAVMKKLVGPDKVLAVLGPTFSNSAAEADPVANSAKTPVLAVSNTGPGIVGDCPYPCEYIFRNSLGEEDAIPANIREYADESGAKTAAVLHPAEDPFGASSAETAVKAFKKAGIEVVLDTVYPGDLKSAVRKDPDAVMVAASSGEVVVQMIKDLRDAGFKGQILGGNAFNSVSTSDAAGESGKGAQSAAAWYSGNASDENKDFIADYEAEYGTPPDQFAAQAYTGIELLAEAIEDGKLSLKPEDLAADREALKASLETVHEETPLGDFRFTADHDVVQPIWIVQMDGQGGFELVKELTPK